MGLKRSANDVEESRAVTRRQHSKRLKLTSSSEGDRDSSAPSSRSISEDSALQSSPPASDHGRKGSVSSIQSPVSDNDSVSSLADSESDPSSDSSASGDEEIITIGGPKKPHMMQTGVTEGAQDLRTRLDALLPQMAASNALLSSDADGLNMEDVDEGEQHIEMNLGLGVLEEKRGGASDGGSESSSEGDDEEDLEEITSNTVQRSSEYRHSDAIRKAFDQSRQRRRPGIEDIG